MGKIGLTVRGLYGEGTEVLGNLYQISNQMTLGEEEEEIINKLENVIYQVIKKEREIRNNLLGKRKNEMEDRVFRSMGLLKFSRRMSSREAMEHLSNIRLGMEMGIINDMKFEDITKLMIQTQPGNIQKNIDKELNREERNIIRANLLREMI